MKTNYLKRFLLVALKRTVAGFALLGPTFNFRWAWISELLRAEGKAEVIAVTKTESLK